MWNNVRNRLVESSVNSEVPELPSGPEAADAAPATERTPALSDEGQAAAASAPAQPVATSVPGVPGAPGMPAMPGEAAVEELDEDDDFEIPEDVGYEGIVRGTKTSRAEPQSESSDMQRGRIVGKRADGVFVDIGEKSEAFLPVDPNSNTAEPLEIGQTIEVIVVGQSQEGYPLLSDLKAQKPKDWAQLETAYHARGTVLGRVTGTIKGGLSVDVGVRAFMPASRSGERTEEGLKSLVGQQVRARIVQLDEADRNVVLDRRAVLDEERAQKRRDVLENLNRGDRVRGVVRSLRKFGAFVDLGGIDGLLHVSDIAWQRVNDPADVLRIGQELEVEILKVDRKLQRIGVGLKQLQPEPWSVVGDTFKVNERIRGKVTRLKEYGAFVEVVPGIEGLVHISDMSFSRRVRHPSEIVNPGDVVEVMVLEIKPQQRRIALGLKQALGDPWQRVTELHPVGSVATGTVRKIMNFGAFVEVIAGVEGLLHVSDITSERRLSSPAEMLRVGESVRVKVMEIDTQRKRMKLGMKQLEPTELENFMAQVEVGETVTGRVVEAQEDGAIVELGTGIRAVCATSREGAGAKKGSALGQTSDLSSLKTMLESAWKGGPEGPGGGAEDPLTPGSVHSFRITKLDARNGSIELARA